MGLATLVTVSNANVNNPKPNFKNFLGRWSHMEISFLLYNFRLEYYMQYIPISLLPTKIAKAYIRHVLNIL